METKFETDDIFDDALQSTNNVPNDQIKQLLESLALSSTSGSSDLPPPFVPSVSTAAYLGEGVNIRNRTEPIAGTELRPIDLDQPGLPRGISNLSRDLNSNETRSDDALVQKQQAAKHSRRKRRTHQITCEMLVENFHLPRKVVERKLSIKRTAFTILRSRHGIRRWPYRLFRDIDNRILRNNEKMKSVDRSNQFMSLRIENDKLARIKELIRANPGLSRNGLTVDALLDYVSQQR